MSHTRKRGDIVKAVDSILVSRLWWIVDFGSNRLAADKRRSDRQCDQRGEKIIDGHQGEKHLALRV